MENGGGGSGGSNGWEAFPIGRPENAKAVQVLERSFGEVHGILEHNRMLIQEISQNHEAREPGGLSRNVALIRELNSNIARVVSLYSTLYIGLDRCVAADAAKKRPRPPQ